MEAAARVRQHLIGADCPAATQPPFPEFSAATTSSFPQLFTVDRPVACHEDSWGSALHLVIFQDFPLDFTGYFLGTIFRISF